MVYKFNIVSDEVADFKRTIEIDADSTFLELRKAIIDSVGYTDDQMDSFYICDDEWNKEREITLADMGSDSDEDVWIMADTRLSDLIEDDGQKVLYVFDYLAERGFFMEMKESIPGKNLAKPVCTTKRGDAPVQLIGIEELEIKQAAASGSNIFDDDDDFYGDSGYNEDELDREGYVDLDNLDNY